MSSATEHRARGAASCGRRGRVRRRDGRKSFSAVAFVDGASSVERQLWPAAETSRKKVLPGARSRRQGIERTVRRAWPAWTGGRRPRGKEPGESPSWLSPSRRPRWRETRGAARAEVAAAVGARSRSADGWRSARARRKRERRKSPCGGQFWRGEGAEKGRPWRWCRPLAHHGFEL